MEAGINQLARAGPDLGWSLQSEPPVWAGWPFAAAVELPHVTAAAAPVAFPGRATWTAERVRFSLSIADPATLEVIATGRQTIELAGAPPLPFQARRLRLSMALRGDAPATLLAADLDGDIPGGVVHVGALRVELIGPAATIEAAAIAVPGDLGRALGPSIEQARGRVAWRDADGTLELSDLALRWGGLAVMGQATLHLDERLQPAGEGSLLASGLAPALDGLARAGVLPAGSAMAAKAVLSLLAAPAPGQPVRLPVQLAGGVLSLARFPVLRLAELDWGPR
ncbi:MAG: hypothetical protein NVSMB18_35660 [Acetobacteraceae bacterium]